MTCTTIIRTKWGIRHGNLSCCWSRWSWMSTRAHEYIGLSPITTQGSVPFEGNHYMHMYGGDACMHVWIPFHNIDVVRASKSVHSSHTERDQFACGPNICWIPKMHNFDVPHASKTINHAPTQSEVHEAYYIWWSPSPSSTHTTQKESSSMVKLINLSRYRSKWCMHRRWPRGPTDGSITGECPS